MADFGAPTLKPTLLVSNAASVAELYDWRAPHTEPRMRRPRRQCTYVQDGGWDQGDQAYMPIVPLYVAMTAGAALLGAAAHGAALGGRVGQGPVQRWP